MVTEDDKLERARRPGKLAKQLHEFYQGKIEVSLKAPVRSFSDFAIWYTPGVATPCREIAADQSKVWTNTNRGNTIAVVSDGSRVLGLGDIGPQAALPVMEGKSLLFKYLGGVDAFPLCLGTKDPEEIIRTVKNLEPCLGGINLEDIATPRCFEILERLRKEMKIPVWHDDQQGTATVEVAGFLNAAKLVGKELDQMQVTMIGAGAANIRIASILTKVGVRPRNIIMCDSKGIINEERDDLEHLKSSNPEKYRGCIEVLGGLSGMHVEIMFTRFRCPALCFQAGPGHGHKGDDQGHGRPRHRLRCGEPGTGDMAVGCQGSRGLYRRDGKVRFP